jgi:hypothetical protein
MAQIYTDAYVTIVASAAKDAAHGFLEPRNAASGCHTLPSTVSPNDFGSVVAQTPVVHPGKQPTDEQAWTLQEHLLSRHLLLCTSRFLQWQCTTNTQNLGSFLEMEFGPGGRIDGMKLVS